MMHARFYNVNHEIPSLRRKAFDQSPCLIFDQPWLS
jgi:hypothetical protein